MPISKFRVVVVVVILCTSLSISLAMARLLVYYTIPSSGSIGPIILDHEVADNSEMRGVFFHFASLGASNDWNLIVNTLHDYNVNLLVIEGMTPKYAGYPSNVIPGSAGLNFIDEAIEVAHPLGIEVYIAMDVLLQTPKSEWGCVDSQGNFIDWLCPTKQEVRDYLKAIVEELVTNYPDIDGFMFDFLRWEFQGAVPDMDYSQESKLALENWLGETVTDFPGEFAPGGSRYYEFLVWRAEAITQLLADMIGWMRAIKSDLKMTAAVWTMLTEAPDCADPRKLLGQDWADWVMKDYLDWVAPMAYFYPRELETLFRPSVRDDVALGVGGPEGKIPVVMFVANQFPVVKTPEEFKAEIDVLREEGADGWIIWRYTGPGVGGVDIRPYLEAIDMFNVFTISDIDVQDTTISWSTNQPASSKVELSETPLFKTGFVNCPKCDFDIRDVDHVPGTIVEDSSLVTSHSIELVGLHSDTKYYFRVQSEDSNGIATSLVYTFTTGDV